MRISLVFPAVVAATLLAGVLVGCDDAANVQERSSAALEEPKDAPEGSAQQNMNEAARSAAERSRQIAADVADGIERGWERTKEAAREGAEALAGVPGEPDTFIERAWEQTKEQAHRVGDVMKETASEADHVLGAAWERTKDMARRMREAWGGAPVDANDEPTGKESPAGEGRPAGEVRL